MTVALYERSINSVIRNSQEVHCVYVQLTPTVITTVSEQLFCVLRTVFVCFYVFLVMLTGFVQLLISYLSISVDGPLWKLTYTKQAMPLYVIHFDTFT